MGGSPWRSLSRHWATSRKVAGSIPDGVIRIFHWHNPSAALWPWGRLTLQQKWVPGICRGGVKAAGASDWQSYRFHEPIVLKSGIFSLLESSRSVQGSTGIAFTNAPLQRTITCSYFIWILSSNIYIYI